VVGPSQRAGLTALENWDRLAAHYDRQLWLERDAIRLALDLAAPRETDRLLDIGTGTGLVLRELARRQDRPEAAVGIDRSAEMLRRVPKLPNGWEVRHASALDLPFASAEFDVAIVAYVLHVLADESVPRVLAEVARVLRPGGRLVTVTPVVPARGVGHAVATLTGTFARLSPQRLGGLRPMDPTTAIDAAGFTIERTRITVRGYPSVCLLAVAGDDGSARVRRPAS